MKRRAAIGILMCVLWAATPVVAARPTIEYLDFSGLAFTLSGVCPFDIYEEPAGNKEKIATFYDESGNITFQVITGVNKWKLTNTSTGKVLTINASGPARLFIQPGQNTVRAEGGGVSFYYIQNPPAGIPTYALTKGRVVTELDLSTFNVTNVSTQQGTVQGICELRQ